MHFLPGVIYASACHVDGYKLRRNFLKREKERCLLQPGSE